MLLRRIMQCTATYKHLKRFVQSLFKRLQYRDSDEPRQKWNEYFVQLHRRPLTIGMQIGMLFPSLFYLPSPILSASLPFRFFFFLPLKTARD